MGTEYFDVILEKTMPLMDLYYPKPTEEEERDFEKAIDDGFNLIYVGVTFSCLLLLMTILRGGPYIGNSIGFFFAYLFLFLAIAVSSGGIRQITMKGFGEARLVLEKLPVSVSDARYIETWCRLRQLPPKWKFIQEMSFKEAGTVYDALERDFSTSGVRPFFEVHDSFAEKAYANAGYIGLFFFMSVVFFWLWAVSALGYMSFEEKSLMVIVLFAAVEEVAKGIGYIITPTLHGGLKVGSTQLADSFGKGLIAGCGFAFAETFMRLERGVNPVGNFILRLPTMGVHMLSSAVFFVGLSWIGKAATKTKNREDFAVGLIALVLAVGIHAGWNTLVWWLFG